MLTIITNTLLGINIIVVIYLVLRVRELERITNDLFHQLAHHQQDVNELLKVNNPHVYRSHKIKQENRIRREMGIPLVVDDEPNWLDPKTYTESSNKKGV